MPLDIPMPFEADPLLLTVDNVYLPQDSEDVICWIDANAPALATTHSLYRNQDRVIFQHKRRHEGYLVRQGPKYAMCTDVIYGKGKE